MIGWILLGLLSNPTGVVSIDFPGLVSFGGLRGATKTVQKNNNEQSDESLSNSIDEEDELEWKLYNNELDEYPFDDDYPFDDEYPEDPNSLLEVSENGQEERELHPGHYRRRHNYHYNHYHGPAYYQSNVYGPHRGYYGYGGYGYGYRHYNYNSFVHSHTGGGGSYWNGHYHGRRRPSGFYYAYNDDLFGYNNFFV